ncbi:hypothetical protein FB558_1563 [Pseudonocardia kunmingensis]|uniref:Uncharacterized protein n=1 Tax=Pseudonocardia kunmingensis TaxID=630975 RepID=A0A543DZL6_9PSEU|nr:hypothetical protein FB558_1563 [Pseudonocardia kunmingensis]
MHNGTDPSSGVAGCIDAAARFLAAQPGAVERMLSMHRPRGDGRCSACRPLVHWPCTMANIARAAAARSHPVHGER